METLKVIGEVIWEVITWIPEIYLGIMDSLNIPDFWQIIITIGIIGLIAFGGFKILKGYKK